MTAMRETRGYPLPWLFLPMLCLLAACESATDASQSKTPAFSPNKLTIAADVNKATTIRPITIMVTAMPVVSGKGSIWLRGASDDLESGIIVISPHADTLRRRIGNDSDAYVSVPAEFTAGKLFRQDWIVQLPMNDSSSRFTFNANVRLDSIFVADSMKMLPINSEPVYRQAGNSRGYGELTFASTFWLYR